MKPRNYVIESPVYLGEFVEAAGTEESRPGSVGVAENPVWVGDFVDTPPAANGSGPGRSFVVLRKNAPPLAVRGDGWRATKRGAYFEVFVNAAGGTVAVGLFPADRVERIYEGELPPTPPA